MWLKLPRMGQVLMAMLGGLVAAGAFAQDSEGGSADELARAKKLYMTCAACHTNDGSGRHAAGPNLAEVVGRPIGKAKGFSFSPAMKSAKGTWTPQKLDEFLKSPSAAIPGTNMAFAGIANEQDRAAMVRFLSTKP
ncbi:cytochrome c family protein [Comamonas humi]